MKSKIKLIQTAGIWCEEQIQREALKNSSLSILFLFKWSQSILVFEISIYTVQLEKLTQISA